MNAAGVPHDPGPKRRMRRCIVGIALVAFLLSCTRAPEANFPPALSAQTPDHSSNLYSVAWLSHSFPAEVKHGTQQWASVTFKNSSPRVWNSFVRLNYTWGREGAPPEPSGPNRTFLGRPVASGEIVCLDHVPIDVPAEPGRYTLSFDLINEMVARFSDRGAGVLSVPVRVK